MLREMERDFFNGSPKEWGVMGRAPGLAVMASAFCGIYYVLLVVSEWWARALGGFSLVFLASMLVYFRVRKDKATWRARLGEGDVSIDYIEACIEEEQARRIVEHRTASRQVVESGIRDIENLDKKALEWREPVVPGAMFAIVVSLGTLLLQRVTERLVQQGRFGDVVGIFIVGMLIVILAGVGYVRVNSFLFGRTRRRRAFYRALVVARSFIENERRPAPWLDVRGEPVASSTDGRRDNVRKRKGSRRRR